MHFKRFILLISHFAIVRKQFLGFDFLRNIFVVYVERFLNGKHLKNLSALEATRCIPCSGGTDHTSSWHNRPLPCRPDTRHVNSPLTKLKEKMQISCSKLKIRRDTESEKASSRGFLFMSGVDPQLRHQQFIAYCID